VTIECGWRELYLYSSSGALQVGDSAKLTFTRCIMSTYAEGGAAAVEPEDDAFSTLFGKGEQALVTVIESYLEQPCMVRIASVIVEYALKAPKANAAPLHPLVRLTGFTLSRVHLYSALARPLSRKHGRAVYNEPRRAQGVGGGRADEPH
jgi:hypothetical protein